jgi:DNA polymerase/3'-5' exonuclease PolX
LHRYTTVAGIGKGIGDKIDQYMATGRGYTRPHFSSTRAVFDTKYTLYTLYTP